jgi:hypothetical protein
MEDYTSNSCTPNSYYFSRILHTLSFQQSNFSTKFSSLYISLFQSLHQNCNTFSHIAHQRIRATRVLHNLHFTRLFRILLRSSSFAKPRHPLSKVITSILSNYYFLFTSSFFSLSHFTSFFLSKPLLFSNDPCAGSPTQTLLRLLLPLKGTVRKGLQNTMNLTPQYSTPPFSPQLSIGSSDGRCIQRAGTKSALLDEQSLLVIPGSRRIITIVNPHI